jgi:hypothetical protein
LKIQKFHLRDFPRNEKMRNFIKCLQIFDFSATMGNLIDRVVSAFHF